MQVQVDIEFDELLKIVKTLPSGKLKQLKAEIEKKAKSDKSIDLEQLLLKGLLQLKSNWKRLLKTEKLSTNGGQNNIG